MNESVKRFIHECGQRGFGRKGAVFSRCLGDGVYQNVSMAQKASTGYALPGKAKKVSRITLGIWSMYANLSPLRFSLREHTNFFSPENIVGRRFDISTFPGPEEECEIMCDKGFDLLDSIVTQRTLLDTVYEWYKVRVGMFPTHEPDLAAPFFLCGEVSDALNQLYGLYSQHWLAFHDMHDALRDAGEYSQYLQKERECEDSLREHVHFLTLILGNRQEEIREYLSENFKRNVEMAKKENIPFLPSFKSCV